LRGMGDIVGATVRYRPVQIKPMKAAMRMRRRRGRVPFAGNRWRAN
jgi:hypothetical protein